MRLLIVEDEPKLARAVKTGLVDAGFTVDVATGAGDAAEAMANFLYDAAVLDLRLPDGDGLELLGAWRRRGNTTPVLILTARDAVEDRVAGLNGGGDDYLVKPFAMSELIARVKALLRRPGGALGLTLTAANVALDTIGRDVAVDGLPLKLPRHELAILELLMRRLGRVIPHEVLQEKLYGLEEEPESNPVPVHVYRLRRRLESAGARIQIHTVRGLGYLLLCEDPS